MLNLRDVERDLDNMRRVQAELERIQSEAGTLGVFLVDENGFLIGEAGSIDLDRTALSALVAASFGATSEIARLLGEADFSRLIHQGKDRHLFIGKAGARHILIVVFDRSTNLGLVKLYAEKVAARIGEIFAEVAQTPQGDAGSGDADAAGGLFPAWLDDKT